MEEDEVAIGDLQNKVPFGVGGGSSGRTLQRSSQLFWPTEMECSRMESELLALEGRGELLRGEESLEPLRGEQSF